MGANNRIRMGLIGSGGRGREDWASFLKQTDVEPVGVCDVYDPFREKGIAMTEGRAKGFNAVIKNNPGMEVLDTQPADWDGGREGPGRRITGPGTIALQGHDPKSTVYYKNIRIKPLD